MGNDSGRGRGHWRALAAGGALAAATVALLGGAYELWRFGTSDQVTLDRLRAHLEDRFSAMARSLQNTSESLLAGDAVRRALAGDEQELRDLFDRVGAAVLDAAPAELAVTTYDAAGQARAWGGRPSELPAARILGGAALFATSGPAGPRLVSVQPVFEAGAAPPLRRAGSIAIEQVLSEARPPWRPTEAEFVFPTPIVPVWLRPLEGTSAPARSPDTLLLRAASGEVLLEARLDPAVVARARRAHRQQGLGALFLVVGLTSLLLTGSLLDRKALARTTSAYFRALALIVVLLLAARAALHGSVSAFVSSSEAGAAPGFAQPWAVELLLDGLALLAAVALAGDFVARWRRARRGRRQNAAIRAAMTARFVALQAGAGLVALFVVLGHISLLKTTIAAGEIEALQLSLHPFDSARLVPAVGLLIWEAVIVWATVLLLRIALVPWRLPSRRVGPAVLVCLAWLLPGVGVAAVVRAQGAFDVPLLATLFTLAACAIAACGSARALAWYRHAPQASRLLALAAAFVAPPLLLYPTVDHVADGAKRRLVEQRYAPEAANHPQTLQDRLSRSLEQIDALPGLDRLVASLGRSSPGPQVAAAAQTDSAFLVWRQTELATYRLTSAVEIYGSDGRLASRFALNFPEYGAPDQRWLGSGCRWEVFGEVLPFGAQERRTLHAERAICEPSGADAALARVGAIVVHVMLDYRTLSFLSSQSPYFELFRVAHLPVQEAMHGRDFELAIYGWGEHPYFVSGADAWSLDRETVARVLASRQAFWTVLSKAGVTYHVYIANDRSGIYAVGYPDLGPFDHLVRLAEISTLAASAVVVMVVGAILFTWLASAHPLTGRAILREIRASFYRRLLLAFVASAVVPAVILAFVIRTYFVAELRADVETGAARTAAVAQRVIEETAALQPRDAPALPANDDALVWISQVIDEEVNIFEGPRLVATSERDLFASGLLPTRTPDNVYRAIVLQRRTSFVGEDRIGSFVYRLAAAPVRAGGRDAILTVPLLPREQEIEREIDELDRGIQLGALLFILLGAAIGYSMAERIGDPVRRLTRATRRIARGDFDARVAARSADELQRLVEAFNRMAAELKAQRAELERTHRLAAWADMARQVAHEIKNPLTPIQLSAEHLVHVHADRGSPLSPVLESCVRSILSQVALLRRIAAEFSSFASTPQPRLEPIALADLVEEVIDPYRVGLRNRIAIRVDVSPALPRVALDRVLIARALTNIVENALHAMPGTGTLAISAGGDDHHVQVRIADTGVGMDAEALGRIFEPYFSTKTGGTGLGLAIAKRNVELNGGSIEVHSVKDTGTEVILTFPHAGR